MKRKKPDRKARPANEVTEQEVSEFLEAINRFEGYPRLRDLGRILPSMSDYKINVILRYLQRLGSIIVDNDGYITWTRQGGGKESLTFGDVANLSDDMKKFLNG
ncbi:MAG: hypothetical protein ACREAY_04125 [Nitrososphaera sp.]|uniref:hypothetical protein n=1 Tax=Nitrososphaera sp. TaxID=1971748 RepID=UPI003D6E4BDB